MVVDMHNFNFARGIVRDGPKFGFEVSMVIPRRASDVVVRRLQARAALSISLADQLMDDPWSWRIAEAIDGGAILAGDLAALDGAAAIAGAVVLLPTASAREMLALAIAIERTGPPAAIVLGFHSLRTGEEQPKATNQFMGLLRYAMNRLRRVFPADRIIVNSTNARLAQAMSDLLRQPTWSYSHPIWYDLAEPKPDPEAPPDDGRLTVAVLGGTRLDKGGGMLADIASHAAGLAGRMRLLIQLVERYRVKAGTRIDDGLTDNPLVAIRWGSMPETALIWHLQTVAAVLMPYDPAEYRDRASGIFAFAAAMGRPVIVPGGSWMSEQLEQGLAAGIVVATHEPQGYAKALRRFIDVAPSLGRAAAKRAAAWRDRENGWRHLASISRELRACGIDLPPTPETPPAAATPDEEPGEAPAVARDAGRPVRVRRVRPGEPGGQMGSSG
ncbi:hypothetical protein STHU_37400 [Allostella humosa]|nr:hypothetical protein STHU_37400 [Stella humosa]